MSGRKKHQRKIKQIIITVGDYQEVFELNQKEEFKQKKEVVMDRAQKMWKKIKEYNSNLKNKQASYQLKLPKNEVKLECNKDLFDELFNYNLNDEEFYDFEIQEKGSVMQD